MSSELIQPVSSGTFTPATNVSSETAISWLGRKISPLGVTALTIVALATLLPTASAYGYTTNAFYSDLGCEYDYAGFLSNCCHINEVCTYDWLDRWICQLEEICNYY